jgi:hypothetical protein
MEGETKGGEGGRERGRKGGVWVRVCTYPIDTEPPGGELVLELPHAKRLVDEPQLFRVHIHGFVALVLISVLRCGGFGLCFEACEEGGIKFLRCAVLVILFRRKKDLSLGRRRCCFRHLL